MSRRIDGVSPAEWPEALVRAMGALRAPEGHPNAAMSKGRPKGFAVLESFAVHTELAQSFFPFNGHVLYGTTLSPRLRQFAIMRVAALRRSEYLWAQHIFTAREVGIADHEMALIAIGPEAPLLSELERAVVRSVDELLGEGEISDGTWAALGLHLDDRQRIDLIFTVGCYETVAFFMRSLRLEIDPGIAALLESPRPPIEKDEH